jgi:hypothetical protein
VTEPKFRRHALVSAGGLRPGSVPPACETSDPHRMLFGLIARLDAVTFNIKKPSFKGLRPARPALAVASLKQPSA